MVTMGRVALAAALALPSALAVTDEFVNARWSLIEINVNDDEDGDDVPPHMFRGIVMYDGKPLCDDLFDDHAATVLCRHFQLGNVGTFRGANVDTDDFGADNFSCPENANSLQDCTFDTDFHDCQHYEGVELYCSMWTLQRSEHEINSAGEGSLHDLPDYVGLVHFNSKPLCDDGLNQDAANALCRTMDLGLYGQFVGSQFVGTDDFSADELYCPPDAESIHKCTFSHTEEDCDSHEGVLLTCNWGWSLKTPDTDDAFHNEGFVLYHGEPLCETESMTSYAADMICQEVAWGTGQGIHGVVSFRDRPSEFEGFGAAAPFCSGNAEQIFDCDIPEDEFVCSSDKALYVECSYDGWNLFQAEKEWAPAGADRFLSGFVHYEGLPLCTYGLGDREANMLCHTLHRGYHGEWVSGGGHSADGVDTQFVGHLHCKVGAEHINDCQWETVQGCLSDEAAFLQCHSGWTLEDSKWGGDNPEAGFLFHDGEPICKEGFTDDAATMLCQMWWGIGYVGTWEQKALMTSALFGSPGPKNTLTCPPGARWVEDCDFAAVTEEQIEARQCIFDDGVYLSCHVAWNLEHGENDSEGFVYYDGKPLCDDAMNDHAASLLCNEMGLGRVGRFETRNLDPHFVGSVVDFGADNLLCNPDARWLDDCTFDTEHDCQPREGVWVDCHKGWRLVGGGPSANDGIVHFNGYPLCDDIHGDLLHAGDLICQAMGMGHAVQIRDEVELEFGHEFGADELNCLNANSIDECSIVTDDHDCGIDEGVYLECSRAPWTLYSEEKGSNHEEGIVHFDGRPLCDDGFATREAQMLCDAIAGPGSHVLEALTSQDVGTEHFGADDLSCPEGAQTIGDCTVETEHPEHYCGPSEGVFLKCGLEGQ